MKAQRPGLASPNGRYHISMHDLSLLSPFPEEHPRGTQAKSERDELVTRILSLDAHQKKRCEGPYEVSIKD